MSGSWRWITILLVAGTISLFLGQQSIALGQIGNRLLLFNTVSDLLKGDLWQFITQGELNRHLYVYPEGHQIIGAGTTNWPERMGEVIVRGTVGKTSFLWANPEYPYQLRTISDGSFPWIQVAVCDPRSALKHNLDRTQDLHSAIIDQMRQERIRICALYIEAVAVHVEYSITYRVPKSGIDLTVPQGRDAYVRSFIDESRSRWTIQGIYVDEDIAQTCGFLPGQPLLLLGQNRETNNGGLLRLARVQSAQIQYYPIEGHQVMKSNLVVADIRFHEGRVSVDVRNTGALTAEHVKVLLSLPDSGRLREAVLPSLRPQEELTVKFNVKRSPSDKTVMVQVDPEEQILETDRQDNRMVKRQGFLGW